MKRARFLAAVLLLGAASAQAQQTQLRPAAPERVDAAMNARIRAEGMERSRVLETAVMLSDVHGPRLAGSPQYRRAAEWARDELASYGLRNAALEPWGTRRGWGWEVTRHSVELVSPYYARIIAYPRAWSPATEGTVRGEPVLVSIRGEADLARYRGQLRGKILLNGEVGPDTTRFSAPGRRFTQAALDSMSRITDPGSPRSYREDAGGYAERVRQRQRLFARMREEGVAALLEPSRNFRAVNVSAYQAYDSDVSGAVPAFVVDAGDYARLANLARRGRAPVLEVSLQTRESTTDSVGFNVVAEIPGSDPRLRDEVVVAGGHFDSWTAGTGATDNAAGVAIVMEAARILQAVGAKPRRTIRVAFWDGEEHEEYFGSRGYVRRHFGDPETGRLLPGQAKVSAYFNVDHGAGRIRGLYLQGNAAVRPVLGTFLEPFRDLGAANLTLANTGSTDHMPFVGVGIPAFTFIQDPLDYNTVTHHTHRDVAAALLEDDLKQAAVVVASVLLHTANREELLPRVGR
ncbi:MAG TPA: M20/M25/M40 family metallo-hydrolase [Longimicrobiaceae bacterium]|nr:M20/M25/M40 family metallo-hydrolase [Longimicrobiaceae bacterium]